MKRLLIAFTAFSLAGCQTVQKAPMEAAPMETSSAEVQAMPSSTVQIIDATKEVTFLDLSGFDEDLSMNLGDRNKNVVVVAPAKFSLNNIPERLEKWLSAVKDSGGKVQAKEEKTTVATRGILGALIDLTVSAVKAKKGLDQLETAENYNVLLTYDKQTGQVKDVLFYHR
ncbi:MAG: hypothetical protein COA73_15655 [Candidatus Hydrogenedentota bacterium]|nr:MAG: hypothetical protein COB46_06695 [Rhodospirillaceae bacterium]PCJ53117.1 MAG: hypothetical protein COA73_15655 [Candidatus Hydrogenedentota bacterium]